MKLEIQMRQPPYPVGSNIPRAKEIITNYIKEFNKLGYNKDVRINLWCRGSSGAIYASLFAILSEYECTICHVKKPGEEAHQSSPEPKGMAVNVVIDDTVASGETIRQILKSMRERLCLPHVLIVHNGYSFEKDFTHLITNSK